MSRTKQREQLKNEPLYAILGESLSLGRNNLETAEAVINAGVKTIQYREKNKTWRQKYAEGTAIAKMCRQHGVTFIMNDSVDLAIACGADGIHVGQDDAPLAIARKMAGPDMIIGVSTNTVEEIHTAVLEGADYVGFGPMFPTQSKKDANPVVTAEAVSYALHECSIPVVAIGGIETENIGSLYQQGFRFFAMISAIVSQPDIKSAVTHLRELIEISKKSV